MTSIEKGSESNGKPSGISLEPKPNGLCDDKLFNQRLNRIFQGKMPGTLDYKDAVRIVRDQVEEDLGGDEAEKLEQNFRKNCELLTGYQ